MKLPNDFDPIEFLTQLAAGAVILATTVCLATWFFKTWAGQIIAKTLPLG